MTWTVLQARADEVPVWVWWVLALGVATGMLALAALQQRRFPAEWEAALAAAAASAARVPVDLRSDLARTASPEEHGLLRSAAAARLREAEATFRHLGRTAPHEGCRARAEALAHLSGALVTQLPAHVVRAEPPELGVPPSRSVPPADR